MKHHFWALLVACWLLPGALADDQAVKTDSNSAPQAASAPVSPSAKICPKCHGEMELGTSLDNTTAGNLVIASVWIPGEFDFYDANHFFRNDGNRRWLKMGVKTNTNYVCKSCGYAETYFKPLKSGKP